MGQDPQGSWNRPQEHGLGPPGEEELLTVDPSAADPLEPATLEPAVEGGLPRESRHLARGSTWGVIGQMTPVVITVFLTPYVIHGLGIERYGMFLVTSTLVGFLGTFDGGIMGTARRYFGVYAGSGDVRRATQLLVTLFVMIAGFGLVMSGTGWLVAPQIVSLLHIHADLRPESVFLMRTLGILITFGFFHNLFVGLLMAHHRFAYITKMGFAVYGVWALGLVLTVRDHWGLRGIALVFVAQQVFLALVIVPASLKYVRRAHAGFLERSEIRELVHYSVRMQVSNISVVINTEVDTLVVGAALSVRTVSFFNSGVNFAEQTVEVSSTAASPALASLSNSFGESGEAGALDDLRRLQPIWIVGVTGWFAAAAGSAWFAIIAWLGPQFAIGGTVAIIALMSQMLNMYTVLFRGYCGAIGRPGVASRFGVFAMVSNILLTIPLVFLGPVGVIAATAAGQLLGTLYIIRLVHSKVSSEVPNPLRAVPLVPGVLTALAVAGVELLIRPYLPQGGFGLLACGVPAAAGLVLYLSVVLGPRQLIELVRAALARRRGSDVPWPAIRLRPAPGA